MAIFRGARSPRASYGGGHGAAPGPAAFSGNPPKADPHGRAEKGPILQILPSTAIFCRQPGAGAHESTIAIGGKRTKNWPVDQARGPKRARAKVDGRCSAEGSLRAICLVGGAAIFSDQSPPAPRGQAAEAASSSQGVLPPMKLELVQQRKHRGRRPQCPQAVKATALIHRGPAALQARQARPHPTRMAWACMRSKFSTALIVFQLRSRMNGGRAAHPQEDLDLDAKFRPTSRGQLSSKSLPDCMKSNGEVRLCASNKHGAAELPALQARPSSLWQDGQERERVFVRLRPEMFAERRPTLRERAAFSTQ